MSSVASANAAGQSLPCITFTTPTRSFERFLKGVCISVLHFEQTLFLTIYHLEDTSLASLRAAVRKKLALSPAASLEFLQLRDGKSLDLEDGEIWHFVVATIIDRTIYDR